MEKLLEEHLSQYSSRTPRWTPGSSCRPAGTGARQREMHLQHAAQLGPGWVGLLRPGAPSWMLRAEPAVTGIHSSARGTDANQEPSSGWGLLGEVTSAVEPQPQHLQNGYPGEHPSLLAALSASCLEAMLTVTAGKPEPRPHMGTVSSLPGHLEPAQLSPTPYLPPLSSSLEPPSLLPIPP